jgi:hypothetical protein
MLLCSCCCVPAVVFLQFGNGTLRLTTRQAYQLHGVLKQDLKTVFSSVVKNMGSTLGACGDVNRNVMGPAGGGQSCVCSSVVSSTGWPGGGCRAAAATASHSSVSWQHLWSLVM